MSRCFSFICFLILLAGCANQDPVIQEITNLEKAASDDSEKSGELLSAYQRYIHEHPEDLEHTPAYLLKAAKLAVKESRIQQAVPMLGQLLRKYPNSAAAKEGLATMANMYANKLKLPAFAKPLYEKVKAQDGANKEADDFLAANAGVPALDGYLEGLKTTFIDTTSGNINRTAIRDYQRGVTIRGLTNKDAKTVDWLLSGGETARMVKNNQGALEFYDWILADYSDDPKSSQAMFLKAFTYDNELNQDDIAKPIYEAFLAKYPNNDFADDAKFLLENLGKSDEEIIQSFQKPESTPAN